MGDLLAQRKRAPAGCCTPFRSSQGVLGSGSSWENPTPAPHAHRSFTVQPCKHPHQCAGWSSVLLRLLALAEGGGFRVCGGAKRTLTHPAQ